MAKIDCWTFWSKLFESPSALTKLECVLYDLYYDIIVWHSGCPAAIQWLVESNVSEITGKCLLRASGTQFIVVVFFSLSNRSQFFLFSFSLVGCWRGRAVVHLAPQTMSASVVWSNQTSFFCLLSFCFMFAWPFGIFDFRMRISTLAKKNDAYNITKKLKPRNEKTTKNNKNCRFILPAYKRHGIILRTQFSRSIRFANHRAYRAHNAILIGCLLYWRFLFTSLPGFLVVAIICLFVRTFRTL